MDFSYYDSNNQIKKLDIKIGEKWSENKTDSVYLNSVFNAADNGDDIVQENEFSIVKFLLKKADSIISKTAGDGVVDNKELWEMTKHFKDNYKMSELKNGKIDTIDPNDYTLESLKKRYPEDKYEITVDNDSSDSTVIVIKDKKTTKVILRVYSGTESLASDKRVVMITEDECSPNHITKYYSDDGVIISYVGPDGKIHQPIAEDFNKLLKSKNNSTGKLLDLLKKVNSQNIMIILSQYKENFGTSLVKAIDKNRRLDEATKTKIKQHLTECLKQTDYWITNKPNTKIDGVFNQGDIGDCWFLSSIAAVAIKSKGLQILNDTIKENPDGSYTVKFKGTNKEYIVTPLEIMDYSDFSDGDLDVKILEIAANKHFSLGITHGNPPALALDLLLGTKDKWKNMGRMFKYMICSKLDEDLRNLIKNPNVIMTTATNFFITIGFSTSGEEYEDDIYTHHAYAVVDMDDKYVYLKNPHNVDNPAEAQDKNTFKVPIDVFKKHMDLINYVELG